MINGKTKILGLFGYPVEHTLSPAMHNAASEALDYNACYLPFCVKPEELKEAVAGIKALNFLGVNVTIPHKEKVIPYLDEVDKEAALIGAVNTIVNQNGKLHGYNTDGKGFIQSLEDEGFSTDGVNAFIIGAGGAARAIAFSLIINKAAAVAIYDIEPKKASDLIASLSKLKSKTKILAGDPASINQYRLIVNVTPMGLKDSDPLVVNPKLITSDHTVYDAIYKKTRLLVAAIEKGAKAINGSAMLLWQGVFAYELWTGIFPPVDVMRQALIETWGAQNTDYCVINSCK